MEINKKALHLFDGISLEIHRLLMEGLQSKFFGLHEKYFYFNFLGPWLKNL